MLKILFPLLSLLLLPKSKFLWHQIAISMAVMSLPILLIFPNNLFARTFNSIISLDLLSAPLILLTIWISRLILLARYKIYQINQIIVPFLYAVTILCVVLLGAFSTNNLIIFYILFEASLIPTLILILGWGYQPERLQARFYLILYTITASLPLLINLLVMSNNNNHLSIFISEWIPSSSPASPSAQMLWFFTIIAFMVKMPLYLTHLWLPKAHVEAPVAGSIILAAILLKLGGYGLLRVASIFPILNKSLAPIFTRISMWGAFITGIICLRQTDVKSLIAYSSVGHIGLLIAGAITGTIWGWWGSLLIILAHGLCSSALFALANITYETTHTRSIFLTKGLLNLFPTMSLWWFLMAAGNMAAPPTLNLAGEIILLSRILSFSLRSVILIAFTRFLAAAYSLYLFTATQHGSPLIYSRPLSLTSSRNATIIICHALPLFILITKLDLCLFWIWLYSWKTTLNCSFKSVNPY